MSYYVLNFGATHGAAVLVGYARTSTKEQEAGFEAQKAELLKHGCEKIFEEQVSSFAARLELDDRGLTLRRSPPPVKGRLAAIGGRG